MQWGPVVFVAVLALLIGFFVRPFICGWGAPCTSMDAVYENMGHMAVCNEVALTQYADATKAWLDNKLGFMEYINTFAHTLTSILLMC